MERVSLLQAGDKILKCSASFGNDIWDAKQFGNVVYAIKTRNGAVYLQLQSNGGDLSVMKVSETQPSLFHHSCLVYTAASVIIVATVTVVTASTYGT